MLLRSVGVCAYRLDIAAHGDVDIGGADEGVRAEAFEHGLHAPVLPEVGVAAARSEIGEFEAGGLAQALDLFPEFGCGAGVEDLQLEFAHFAEDGAGAQFHQDGERGDFPEHDLGPAAFKRELSQQERAETTQHCWCVIERATICSAF